MASIVFLSTQDALGPLHKDLQQLLEFSQAPRPSHTCSGLLYPPFSALPPPNHRILLLILLPLVIDHHSTFEFGIYLKLDEQTPNHHPC